MRALFITALLCLVAAVPVTAAPESVAIRAVISAQIEAFRRDDSDAAFAIASPEIQGRFRDPASFLSMVATAYPQVYRPKSVVFLGLGDMEGRLVQRVLITGPEDRTVLALYEMQKIDGAWRINGCVLVTPPEKEI